MSEEWEVERISSDEYRVRRKGVEAAGLGGLGVLLFIGYMVKGILDFIKENWIYIVSIIGIIIACVVACIIIGCKSKKKTGLKITVTIICSALLIVGVCTLLPKMIGKSNAGLDASESYETSALQNVYMYVDVSGGLNMRSTPDPNSSSNIVVTLPSNARLRVLNTDSNWYYVEYSGDRTYTGYVNSKYLRY